MVLIPSLSYFAPISALLYGLRSTQTCVLFHTYSLIVRLCCGMHGLCKANMVGLYNHGPSESFQETEHLPLAPFPRIQQDVRYTTSVLQLL